MPGRIFDQDDFILHMLLNDDEQGLVLLFDQYYEVLHDLVTAIIHSPEDGDDLIQELFISVWSKRHTLKLSKPLSRYLLKAAQNRAKNHIRDNRRRKTIPIDDVDLLENRVVTQPVDSALSAEDIDKLWSIARTRMSSKVRVTFMLSRNFQMTYPEIASYLGVSIKAVEKNISTALQILREVFSIYLKSCLPVASIYSLLM